MDDSKLMQIVKQYTGEGTIHINTALKNDKSRFHKALNMLNNANRGVFNISTTRRIPVSRSERFY